MAKPFFVFWSIIFVKKVVNWTYMVNLNIQTVESRENHGLHFNLNADKRRSQPISDCVPWTIFYDYPTEVNKNTLHITIC